MTATSTNQENLSSLNRQPDRLDLRLPEAVGSLNRDNLYKEIAQQAVNISKKPAALGHSVLVTVAGLVTNPIGGFLDGLLKVPFKEKKIRPEEETPAIKKTEDEAPVYRKPLRVQVSNDLQNNQGSEQRSPKIADSFPSAFENDKVL